ncbi:MAG: histidine phosphatase family protein [Firmicutes bacterium]|nr:histidine phosphatase family protein [Bacillota bacterium]
MKILFIRHGDPDYEHDTLTERGFEEAEILSEYLKNLPIKAFYVSPLGRAQATAAPALRKMGMTATTCDWLKEFSLVLTDPVTGEKRIPWDFKPSEWLDIPQYQDPDKWFTTPFMRTGPIEETAREVYAGFDSILASHGYRREGRWYRAERPNRDTIAFVCHFGVECLLLSYLYHVSPVLLWHYTLARTTSVTTLASEEREEGIALFRCLSYGDVSHLSIAKKEPTFAGRFCERYIDMDERH